ncbi:hypothetical protein ACFPRL_29415 [Pseudoclavibacter helvolus]
MAACPWRQDHRQDGDKRHGGDDAVDDKTHAGAENCSLGHPPSLADESRLAAACRPACCDRTPQTSSTSTAPHREARS